jgi:hypothetical protein
MENSGILYVLTNPFMPGLVKIGCTTGPVEDRIKTLSAATGVPVAFQCHFAAKVDDTAVKEKTLHQLFSDKRVNPNREFFQVAPEKIVLAIRMGSFIEVTPGKVDIPKEEEQALEKAEEAETRGEPRSILTQSESGLVLRLPCREMKMFMQRSSAEIGWSMRDRS